MIHLCAALFFGSDIQKYEFVSAHKPFFCLKISIDV